MSTDHRSLRYDLTINGHSLALNSFPLIVFNASDLPKPERLAYFRRQIEEQKLDPGTHNDAAHAAFIEATLARRDRAERKAAIARL
ncbi:hypothetical protein [Parasedimentitalea psychrophila]|uniref:Uncharacterized protein n=1 Tax=Parasedimentitalea psychrophila TaxID=2997337 RepID=A0A9Y2P3V5_9RHOB|nr:hypothetical protein [Parasedimentitalea psychrophila]WIY26402.1 hypothetical protein QPJ95_05670 [Parasedimentitalea psychrophila]